MSSIWSRILISVAGIPVVLWLVYLGGWWLFALVLAAALVGLHELYWMTRTLRPVVLAGYLGALGGLLGAQMGGPEWALAGFMSTFVLAFIFKGVAGTRQSTAVSVSVTVLGAGWIGLGLAHALLLRDIPEHGILAAFAVLLAVWAGDSAAFLVGMLFGRHKLAPTVSPGKTWEGLIGGTVATIGAIFFAFYQEKAGLPVDSGDADPRRRDRRRRSSGRPLRVGSQARHGGEGLEPPAGGPRGCSGSHGRTALRLGRRVLRDRRLRTGLGPLHFRGEADSRPRRDRLDRAPGSRDHRRPAGARGVRACLGVERPRRAGGRAWGRARAGRRRPRRAPGQGGAGRRPERGRRLRGAPGDDLGARARRHARPCEQGEPRRRRRPRACRQGAGRRTAPAGRQRALRALPVPRGPGRRDRRLDRADSLGRPLPRPHAGRAPGRHARGCACAPDLAHGPEDHRRLGNARQQGSRADRGPLPVRLAVRANRGRRSSDLGRPRDRPAEGRFCARPSRVSRHARADLVRPHLSRARGHTG